MASFRRRWFNGRIALRLRASWSDEQRRDQSNGRQSHKIFLDAPHFTTNALTSVEVVEEFVNATIASMVRYASEFRIGLQLRRQYLSELEWSHGTDVASSRPG
jgi:hypothetical protein